MQSLASDVSVMNSKILVHLKHKLIISIRILFNNNIADVDKIPLLLKNLFCIEYLLIFKIGIHKLFNKSFSLIASSINVVLSL